MRYDPERAPSPRAWLEMGEPERMDAVERWHRRARVRVPSMPAHVAIHTAVETQVAMGDATPVAATVRRLMGEGLSRHDAVHAAGSALVEHFQRLLVHEGEPEGDPNAAYYADLAKLTRRAWLEMAE